MSGIIRYQPNNVDTALQALHSVLEFAPDSEPARESRRYLDAPYQRRLKG